MNAAAPIAPIEALRERCLEGRATHRRAVLPFGVNVIDEHLPEGGLAVGALHEVASGGNGAVDGAAAALFTAGIAGTDEGTRAVRRQPSGLFAPALALVGITPDRVIYVEAGDEKAVLALFRRGPATPQTRRGRRGSWPPLHDGFAETAARRGRLWRDRPCTAALAPPSRRRRFRTADGGDDALARHVAAIDSIASSGAWDAPDGGSNWSGAATAKVQNSR